LDFRADIIESIDELGSVPCDDHSHQMKLTASFVECRSSGQFLRVGIGVTRTNDEVTAVKATLRALFAAPANNDPDQFAAHYAAFQNSPANPD
jgi:hypothetical protein